MIAATHTDGGRPAQQHFKNRSGRLRAAVLGAVAGGAGLLTVCAGVLYDLGDDFSTVQNPNGVWSYNNAGSPIQTPITNPGIGLPYLVGWGGAPDMNASITTVTYAPPDLFWKDLLAGDVALHTSGTDVAITWTSPGTGLIDLSGAAWDAYFDPRRDASWALSVNGTTVAEHSSVFDLLRTDAAASFANNVLPGKTLSGIPVSPGDLVEFTTDSSAYQHGHFLGVDITVDFTAVPEPISSGIAVLALVGLAVTRRLADRKSLSGSPGRWTGVSSWSQK